MAKRERIASKVTAATKNEKRTTMTTLESARPRVAILGAASLSLGPAIVNDLLVEPALDGMTLTLMGPHEQRVAVVARWASRAVQRNGLRTVVRATTSCREALGDADLVIALFDAGGFEAFDTDYRIATAYGLDICIGDTTGPTGIMKGLRNIYALEGIAQDYRELCPDAVCLSYVNPMAPLVMAAHRLGIERCVGLCGGVEATHRLIARCLRVEPERLETSFAGINHMCWALRIQEGGHDLYPRFREQMARAEWRAAEPARSEVLQHFGYIPTETSGHLSDMLPWFRRDARTRARYGRAPGYAGASGTYHRYASYLNSRLEGEDYLRFEDGALSPQSRDYGASIVAALHGGATIRAYGNVLNRGKLLEDLPEGACVEVPIAIDQDGVHPRQVGKLPPQLAALCGTNVPVHQLTVAAALGRDPELVAAAIAMDPLTQATLDLPKARELTSELLDANAGLIPDAVRSGLKQVWPVGADVPAPAPRSTLPTEGPFATLRRFDKSRRDWAANPQRQ